MEESKLCIEVLKKFLIGRFMTSFLFNQFFTLEFYKDQNTQSDAVYIQLQILGDWWFGNKHEWDTKVNKYGKGVEPEEPILAYELALLRWSDGSNIVDIVDQIDNIAILLENKNTIHISKKSYEDEYAFVLLNKDNNDTIISCFYNM